MASVRPYPSSPPVKLRVCMVSDFFYPGLGGVETHIYQLSEALILRGFKVIVVTHFSGKRHGIRYMANGLKVYYLPTISYLGPVVWPCVLDVAPLFKQILVRERIDIVHGHQTTSVLAMQCLFHAKTLNRRAIYTEHSLFGFDDAASIHLNGAQLLFLADLDHAICVSHCSRENFVLRNKCDPLRVSVINNAVDSAKFYPDLSKRPPPPRINIVVISRLTYRKGVDLLIQLIPFICKQHLNIHFIIGGDGNMRNILEEMRDTFELRERVTFLGAVPHHEVCNVLQMGHIFLSCSLSEAFCIAILEAVSCGLIVVSTNVGGVSEVLPASAAILAEPNVEAICSSLEEALKLISLKDPFYLHRQVLLQSFIRTI
ncbi:N-acetylglucosaminyl-phosphatidylinositol biosynthetic protein PigA, family GT4 protein [Cardiosporidium cionae]|uniref:N-acetylglucosaminyl-phosphatidylinositol biosynthetic protein PigA, family GT4 protein n=1 Tax=Cardiosporidium cionae TaxID=476202 RepID=A0ABQ7JEU1_9APIC|nr:N-acetylglucosaminyl-phosphatidylinositol biosynthetic protein PigA, family GT4 protein [Cardiosporidium cionae]|eukprot:KAF8822491.1 N-acetylglucosaminyl-phosphatidylinositol biosynthetic protein PigA, family GT4 protein [Cardiosporidium cionae]